MSQVNIEKPQRETITPQFVEALQKIGFVSVAGLPQRSLRERLQLFNPFDEEYKAAIRERYEEFADGDGLFVAVAKRLGKDEVVGFALVEKPSVYDEESSGSTQSYNINQLVVLPCATINTNEVSGLLVSAIREDIGSEQAITTTVLAEQVLALRALLIHGFKHDASTPDLLIDHFGEGTLPAIRHTLVLPGVLRLTTVPA